MFEISSQSGAANSVGLLLLVLSVAHIVATWGFTGFWNDAGRWRYEIERYANGELPYREFSYMFPPLSLWIVGGIARLFGSTVNVLFAATSVICLFIFAGYWRYVCTLVPSSLALLTAASGFLLSVAYACTGGDALPAGMYMPGVPLGFLFLIWAVVCTLSSLRRQKYLWSMSAGILSGLCILTKQDFWVPAVYLVLCLSGYYVFHLRRWALGAAVLGAFLGITVAGAAYVAGYTDWATLAAIPGGFGNVSEMSGSRGMPSGEQITVQVLALALLALGVLLSFGCCAPHEVPDLRRWVSIACLTGVCAYALYMFMTFRTDGRQAGFAVLPFTAALINKLQLQMVPLFAPFLVAALIASRWNSLRSPEIRNTVMLLLGLCIAARARRLFEQVEWFHFLIELPVYILAIRLLAESSRIPWQQSMRVFLAGLTLVGLYSYWDLGNGWMTRQGSSYELVSTPKGSVRWTVKQAAQFRGIRDALDRLDQSGKRSLFAIGYSGGFNYYLNRPNPSPVTTSIRFSHIKPSKLMADLRSARPLLLDNNYYDIIRIPVITSDLLIWKHKTVENVIVQFDRPFFQSVAAGCQKVQEIAEPRFSRGFPRFVLYDCGSQQ